MVSRAGSVQCRYCGGLLPPEFRRGYTLARIHDGVLELDIRVTGAEAKVSKKLPVRCS